MDAPSLRCGAHGLRAWRRARPALQEVAALPFLHELADGTLPTEVFVHYLLQDSAYLAGYGRSMTLLAARARTPEQLRFWAGATSETIAEEQSMQAQLMGSEEFSAAARSMTVDGRPDPSPTTLGYTSWLIAAAAVDDYEVAVAAVLPCFWVYAEVGRHLVSAIGDRMDAHPYRAWVEVYSDPEFDRAVEEAVGIFEELYEDADEELRERMLEAFVRGCVYERHFWDAAHAMEDWSRGPRGREEQHR